MKIYIAHSREFDFKKELYEPIKKSPLYKKYEIILPHEKSDKSFSTKELFREKGNILIADISKPSTGLGIELGWVNAFENRIICVYKKGSIFSDSIRTVTTEFIEYETPADLILKIQTLLGN
ncbi:MAG: hypothetical protein WCW13_01960 [archaeon]|jgi:hypothetical protein